MALWSDNVILNLSPLWADPAPRRRFATNFSGSWVMPYIAGSKRTQTDGNLKLLLIWWPKLNGSVSVQFIVNDPHITDPITTAGTVQHPSC